MKVKGIQTKFNIITLLIAVVYVAVMAVSNVGYASISVATIEGSYASEFADKKGLNKYNLTDSEKLYLDIRYENFNYNKNDDGTICLESYKGDSESIVIPYIYDDKLVSALGEKFFDGHESLKDIYLPITVKEIKAEPVKGVIIHVDKDSILLENEEWEVVELYDSDYVNYFNSDIPFSYNETNDSIELVGYLGDDDLLVIPSYVNGKPVKTVSFDMLGDFSLVVFPETIAEITGEVGRVFFTSVFAVGLVFSILAFVLVLTFVNMVFSKVKKDLQEVVLSSPQIILSMIYLIGQLIFSVLTTFKINLGLLVVLVVCIVWTILYLILLVMAKVGRNYEKTVETKMEERITDMKIIKEMVKELAVEISDKELRKEVECVVEEVKYLSLGSKNPEIENQLFDSISAVKGYIAKNDVDNIKKYCNQIILLCKKR